MALQPVNPFGERRDGLPRPCIAACPVCDGEMHVIYARNNQQVCGCEDCRTTITVPATAWARSRNRGALHAVSPPRQDL